MAKETFSSFVDLFKTSSSSTVSSLGCDVCGQKLSVFRKKKPCAECKRVFCSQCLQRGRDHALRCKNCCILTMRPPLRSALLDLRIKDLQHYLNQHNVSTRGCLEKEDLVNVLLRYASAPANPSTGGSQARNPTYAPSGSARQPSTQTTGGNSKTSSAENTGNQTGNLNSGATFTATATSSSYVSTSPQGSGPGDSDSSSDTSFEIVQRPSSDENITSVHSSSSSNSVSAASSQATSSTSAPLGTPAAVPNPQGEYERPVGVTSSALRQPSLEQTATGLESLSMNFPIDARSQATPEIVVELDAPSENTSEIPTQSQSVSQTNSSNNSSNNSPNLLRGTMASITCEADFEALSVKQLKDILHRHRVNYHGCCEKAELVEKAKRLFRDYCSSRAELEKLDLDQLCKICMDAPVECVMLECGHMATCTDCGRQLSECPICRQFVVRIVRTFKA